MVRIKRKRELIVNSMGHYYLENLEQDLITMSSDESKHLTKVLRKKLGDQLIFTDGKGTIAKAEIIEISRHECRVQIIEREYNIGKRDFQLEIAVAPTKNSDRIEWMVEKAVEIGVEKITFIICERSERKHVEIGRMERIAIAALKQSSGTYLPEIKMVSFKEFLNSLNPSNINEIRLIAWCENFENTPHIKQFSLDYQKITLLIGPEGDFTHLEVEKAKKNQFQEVKLGNKILRTETAAVYGCCAISVLKS